MKRQTLLIPLEQLDVATAYSNTPRLFHYVNR